MPPNVTPFCEGCLFLRHSTPKLTAFDRMGEGGDFFKWLGYVSFYYRLCPCSLLAASISTDESFIRLLQKLAG